MRKQMTLGAQVTYGLLVAIALFLALGYSSHASIGRIGRDLDTAVNVVAHKTQLVAELRSDFQGMRTYAIRTQFDFVVNHLVKNDPQQGASATCSMCHVETSRETREHGLKAIAEDVKATLSELQPLANTQLDKNCLTAVGTGVDQYLSMYSQYLSLVNQNRYDDAHAVLRDQMFPVVTSVEKALADMSDEGRNAVRASAQSASYIVSFNQWITVGLILVCLLVTSGILWRLRRSTAGLCRLAGELNMGADQLAGAAAQISASSQSLAHGSSEQATSLEETSASSEQIHGVTRQNRELSSKIASLVAESQHKFANTNRALNEMVAAMSQITTSSSKIAQVIKVIDEIAFQTNILALNAAVEAARAGDSGLGFAVVANEVRNLAQRCAQAARDTTGLIEDSIARSNEGQGKVSQVAGSVAALSEESAKIRALIDELSQGSRQQAEGIEQMVGALSQIEQVTCNTAANAEESASAAEEMNAQSQSLRDIVGRLTAIVGSSVEADPGVRS